jgi:sulfonate transport system substrate-binding protein
MKFGLILKRLACTAVLLGAVFAQPVCAASIKSLDISYAYYDPLSLILKDKSYLQDALGPDVKISWVLSQGSNQALEYLRSNSIQFGQTAGSAALLSRANGTPVQVIATTAFSEWTAIVVRPNSPIKTIADLKGKRVAATPGTDPYIFLLRALATKGLRLSDIQLVPLQHPLGRQALDADRVDAWAGLDPFMAEAQLQQHDILIYRNKTFISPGTLLVRDDFEKAHPDVVDAVLRAYAKARAWAIVHPEGTAEILAKDSGVSLAVARKQLTRVNFFGEAVGAAQVASILAAGPILKESGDLTADANLQEAGATLVNTSFTSALKIK